MIGRPAQWPKWPEFSQSAAEGGDDLVGYKQAIIAKFGQEALTKSWIKVCARLRDVTDEIAAKGTSVIPELEYEDLFKITSEERERLKEIGCFKVKGVIDQEQVDAWFKELKQYVSDNQGRISGWPTETPFILNLYYSAAQLGARSHPRSLAVARELNSWWSDSSSTSSSDPLSYADGVRIRPPGVPFYGLGPHIDAGSLCRWADPTYQKVYADVFSGNPEKLDIYDLGIRQHAQQAMFPGAAHSRVFRSFQGWTALSTAAPGEGSLMLYPNVKASIAYVLLRPFFRAPETDDENEMLDASQWTFDPDTPWFPGTFREDSQLLSPSSHPHLRLKECLVSIPAMKPGDTIWWHADMCHAVEVEHNGKLDASVAYIAATPSTEVNKKYIKAQLEGFLAGVPPEDFRSGGTNETIFKGYPGEKAVLGGAAGRDAMGFNLIAA